MQGISLPLYTWGRNFELLHALLAHFLRVHGAALAERDEKLAHAAKEIYSLKAINTELEAKLAQYVSLSAPRSVFEGISTKNNARS